MKTINYVILIIGSALFSSAIHAENTLFISNMPYATTSQEVINLVEGFGKVSSVSVNSTDKNGKQTATAMITFVGDDQAVVMALNGFSYGGRQLIVNTDATDELIVVSAKIKEVVRNAGLRSDGELVQAVSEKVHKLLDEAILRAQSNKRGIVRPYDL